MHFANNDPKLPFHEELDRRSAFAYFESSSILDGKKEREKEEKRQLFERWLPRVFSKIIINFFILDWDNLKIRSACYTIFFKFHFTYLYIYIYIRRLYRRNQIAVDTISGRRTRDLRVKQLSIYLRGGFHHRRKSVVAVENYENARNSRVYDQSISAFVVALMQTFPRLHSRHRVTRSFKPPLSRGGRGGRGVCVCRNIFWIMETNRIR